MEYFPGQRPDEKVLTIARPHWLTLLPAILVTGLLAIVPFIIFVAIPAAGLEISGIGRAIAVAATSAYYLALVTYFFVRWIDFYLDIAIVTSDRIVDIDQNGLFRRTIDELDCKMIQDVSAAKHGLLQTLFNFGTVEIQTAGERRNFTFEGIPNPDHVQELVAKSQGMGESEERQESAHENAEASAEQAGKAADQPKQTDDSRHLDSQDLPKDFE